MYSLSSPEIVSICPHSVSFYTYHFPLHERTREAVLETIRICKDQNVLREYLSGREKKVVDIMKMLIGQKAVFAESAGIDL